MPTVVRYQNKQHEDVFIELTLDGAELLVRTAQTQQRARFEGPARARWERDKRVARALADGFLPAFAAPADELHDDELERAIWSSPNDAACYLVYADWLQAQGEPRGELICVQHALSERWPGDPRVDPKQRRSAEVATERLRRAEMILLMAHRERFFGPVLSAVHDIDTQTYVSDLFALQWQLGFIRRASLRQLHEALDDSGAQHDVERVELWRKLLELRSAIFLREIEVHIGEVGQLLDLPDTIEHLTLLMLDPEEYADLYYGVRQLREDEETGTAHADALEQLAQHPSARLSTLTLQLRRFRQQLLDVLVDSPTLRQLRELDLSRGLLDDDDASWLIEHADAFDHLERLDLRRNRFGARAQVQLRRLGPFVVVADRGPAD